MVVDLVMAVEAVEGVLVLGMVPLPHDVHVEETGEVVEVADFQVHYTVSSAGLVLDLEHVVVEG